MSCCPEKDDMQVNLYIAFALRVDDKKITWKIFFFPEKHLYKTKYIDIYIKHNTTLCLVYSTNIRN